MSSNNAFKSVKIDRNYHVLSRCTILPEDQDGYLALIRAGRFVVKRDPHFINVSTQQLRFLNDQMVVGVIERRNAFGIKNDRSFLDMTAVNGVSVTSTP